MYVNTVKLRTKLPVMWDWTWRKPGSTTYDYHLVMLIISDWDWRCPLPVYTNSSSSCLWGIFCCQTSWTCRINPLLLGPLVTTGVIRGTINKMLKLHGLQGIYSAWLETITAHILLMCHLGSFCSVHRFPFFFLGVLVARQNFLQLVKKSENHTNDQRK